MLKLDHEFWVATLATYLFEISYFLTTIKIYCLLNITCFKESSFNPYGHMYLLVLHFLLHIDTVFLLNKGKNISCFECFIKVMYYV